MKFWVDFSGYCVIDANSREEAEDKFCKGLQPPSKEAYDDVYDIVCVEEKTEMDYLSDLQEMMG